MIPTPVSWARIKSLTSLYADATQRGYIDFLNYGDEIRAFGEVAYDAQWVELKRKHEIAGIQTIIFAGMCFEAAIYEYAAIYLGDRYVLDHLDKLDVLSKWLVVLRLVSGYELPKDRAAYQALKELVKARNDLVHKKSEEFHTANPKTQLKELKSGYDKHERNVHNAFRAIVLMSTEIEMYISSTVNPLPSFPLSNPKLPVEIHDLFWLNTPDTLMRDNNRQSLECHHGTET